MPASDAVAIASEDALANFAVRVRRPLDEFVAWRFAELRRHGICVSTAEPTAIPLWELTRDDVTQLAARTALASVFPRHAVLVRC